MGSLPNTCLVPVICFIVLAMGQSSRAQNSPQDYLAPHNSARAQVGVGPLQWDDNLATYAANYANQRIGDCDLIHSGGPYGENIFLGMGRDYSAADAVNMWVSEKQYYDYNSNTCEAGKVCGHYTQVVWRNTSRLGCARVRCDSGAFFIICNYDPPGNYVGQLPYPFPPPYPFPSPSYYLACYF